MALACVKLAKKLTNTGPGETVGLHHSPEEGKQKQWGWPVSSEGEARGANPLHARMVCPMLGLE